TTPSPFMPTRRGSRPTYPAADPRNGSGKSGERRKSICLQVLIELLFGEHSQGSRHSPEAIPDRQQGRVGIERPFRHVAFCMHDALTSPNPVGDEMQFRGDRLFSAPVEDQYSLSVGDRRHSRREVREKLPGLQVSIAHSGSVPIENLTVVNLSALEDQ